MTQQTLKKERGISGKIISGIMNMKYRLFCLIMQWIKSLPGRLIESSPKETKMASWPLLGSGLSDYAVTGVVNMFGGDLYVGTWARFIS